MSVEDDYEQLTHKQRLKAAVHHTTLKICQESEGQGVKPSRMVVAAISEAAWKKMESFATDMEMFAKHGKRTQINADDVKMLVRKTPKLRLKAAVHHTTLKICQESEGQGVKPSRMVVAAISEAAWKKMESFATDMEMFAKHGKRTQINADDVKMLVRKTPKLLQHINSLHDQMNASKGEVKKRSRKTKVNKETTAASTTEMDVDEDSNIM